MRIDVIKLQLPVDSDVIRFTNFDLLGSTVRLEMIIGGIPFKRLNDRGLRKAKPVWLNDTGEVDGCSMLTDEKQLELEGIFKAYCMDNNFSLEQPLKQLR